VDYPNLYYSNCTIPGPEEPCFLDRIVKPLLHTPPIKFWVVDLSPSEVLHVNVALISHGALPFCSFTFIPPTLLFLFHQSCYVRAHTEMHIVCFLVGRGISVTVLHATSLITSFWGIHHCFLLNSNVLSLFYSCGCHHRAICHSILQSLVLRMDYL